MLGRPDIIEELIRLGCAIEPCGWLVTGYPVPTDTDADYSVWLISSAQPERVFETLDQAGFQNESDEYKGPASAFSSWCKGEVNLIVTGDGEFVKRHHAATDVCKRLNLLDKSDRMAVFRAVLYGETSPLSKVVDFE